VKTCRSVSTAALATLFVLQSSVAVVPWEWANRLAADSEQSESKNQE